MAAVDLDVYPHTSNGVSNEDQRLEFWAWDFIADRDTTINIRYHRMEVYGLHAFYIPRRYADVPNLCSADEPDPFS